MINYHKNCQNCKHINKFGKTLNHILADSHGFIVPNNQIIVRATHKEQQQKNAVYISAPEKYAMKM